MTKKERIRIKNAVAAMEKLLGKHGWIKHEWGRGSAPHCLVGAADDAIPDQHVRELALQAISSNITSRAKVARMKTPRMRVMSYNDSPTRRKRDVFALLRRTMKSLEV